jgi:hypothetical protein
MLFYRLGYEFVGVFPLAVLAKYPKRARFFFLLWRKFMPGRENLVKALGRSGPLAFARDSVLC